MLDAAVADCNRALELAFERGFIAEKRFIVQRAAVFYAAEPSFDIGKLIGEGLDLRGGIAGRGRRGTGRNGSRGGSALAGTERPQRHQAALLAVLGAPQIGDRAGEID